MVDSWFVCERFLKGITAIDKNLNVIGQMKSNRKITINGKTYIANKIPELRRKNIHYSRKLKCHYISLKMDYKGIVLRGYWIKMKGQQNWSLLISTDAKLSFVKAMEYYKNRWSIEVFFKDCKQNLGFGNLSIHRSGCPYCHHQHCIHELYGSSIEKEISRL